MILLFFVADNSYAKHDDLVTGLQLNPINTHALIRLSPKIKKIFL